MLEVGDDTLLWDFGPGTYHRMMQAGKRAVDISDVFFSHLHHDLCADYIRLFLTRWDQGADRIPELKVYGPPPIRHMTAQLFGTDGAFAPDLNARIRHQGSIDIFVARGGVPPRQWPQPEITELQPTDTVQGKTWTVTIAPASHVQPWLECYAYRIDCEPRVLFAAAQQ